MNAYDTGSRARRLPADHIRTRLSRPLLVITAVSLTAGIATGGLSYLNRSADQENHVDGTAAWGIHVFLLAATIALTVVAIRRRGTPAFIAMLLSPLSTTAAQRLIRTLRSILNHPTALLRLIVGFLPIALLIYSPFRIGIQILGGLDPNFTANAWGGPTYLGAMACHYLDAALLMAAAAFLLDRLLLPVQELERR
ncbi:hypothetical protein AB0M22_27575 [Nocardia sp. NPDC051756]|uniref:hypothetical protein n=1 Tax=Nocardia sp. NPDC051756 TaxID=3154751 RepID=UPI0034467DBB